MASFARRWHEALATASPWWHVAVVALHAVAAITALAGGLACHLGRNQLVPIVPYALNLSVPASPAQQFRAAAPWAQDGARPLLALNPYMLVMVFEWLTAGFALLYVQHRLVPYLCLGWHTLGVALTAVWIGLSHDSLCPLQDVVVLLLFGRAISLCFWPNERIRPPHAPPAWKLYAPCRSGGRLWLVPPVAHLGNHAAAPPESHADDNRIMARYDEYALTAPLLFLSVVALLLPGAPAWLVLSGLFLIAACNLWGVEVHLAFLARWHQPPRPPLPWAHWLRVVLFAQPWSGQRGQAATVFELSWLCLAAPVLGMLYLTWAVWVSPDVPLIARFMMWNLLVSYCSFGLLPTWVYLTNGHPVPRVLDWVRRDNLGAWLDRLNLMAKLPMPILIAVGLFTRPSGWPACSTS